MFGYIINLTAIIVSQVCKVYYRVYTCTSTISYKKNCDTNQIIKFNVLYNMLDIFETYYTSVKLMARIIIV